MLVSPTTTADATGRRWWALAVLILPVLLISMNSTVLGFAIPELSSALDPTSSQLLWIIDVYSFVLAGLLVTMGVLGDRIGRRKLLLWGASAFSLASVLAAFSTSSTMLIAARGLLGVAGATLMPSTLSLIRNIFTDDRERQFAISVWATTFAVGAAGGPVLGGLLLEHFWWGSVFLVAVPTTLLLVVAAPVLITESRDPSPGRFDLVSSGLSMTAMLPAVYAMKMLAERGMSVTAAAWFIVGAVSARAFVGRQRSLDEPMIDISLFGAPRFRMAISGNLLACFGLAGSMLFVAQYLQLVIGMSPVRAGLQLLPAVLTTIVSMLCAPIGARHLGTFTVIATGLGAGAAGFAVLVMVPVGGSAIPITLATVLIGAGLGSALTVSIDGILAAVPPERAGAGASVSETANELGTALGTAVLGSIAAAIYRVGLADTSGVPHTSLVRSQETLGEAASVATELGGAVGERLRTAADTAFVSGLRGASVIAAVGLALMALWAVRHSWALRHSLGRPSTPDPQ